MTQIIKAHGISEKRMNEAVACIERLAATFKTEVEKVEVIDKDSDGRMTTWIVLYSFTNGKFETLKINKQAIY